jgi:hypothetical protein
MGRRARATSQKGSTMRRSTRALLAGALASMLLMSGAGADEGSTSYTAPFDEGPSSGDQWTLSQRDTDEGRVFIGRAYPIPGVISCDGGNAQEKFEILHEVTAPLSEVGATFEESLVDNYTWVSVGMKDADGEWLARSTQRGPLLLEGELTAALFDNLPEDRIPEVGETVTIEFGLEVASSCANANGGTVRFTEVTVS